MTYDQCYTGSDFRIPSTGHLSVDFQGYELECSVCLRMSHEGPNMNMVCSLCSLFRVALVGLHRTEVDRYRVIIDYSPAE